MLRACLAAMSLFGASCSEGEIDSPIQGDEVVAFFPTCARLTAKGHWEVPIHGWIYEPEEGAEARRMLVDSVRPLLGLTEEQARSPIFQERIRVFLADNERGKEVPIRLGRTVYTLAESEANGHFTASLKLSIGEAGSLVREEKENPWLRFEALTRTQDRRSFRGSVQLVGETGLSVISDIDDTIKVSKVSDRRALIENTFLREFQAVPGMAELYGKWARKGACFHYVSSSPWQLYEPLSDFLEKEGYPAGSFHLKSFRLKDRTFFSLFASAEKTKPKVIEPILETFPQRRFILVGDSGEKDPEVYGAIARKYPEQVERVLIRAVSADDKPEAKRFVQAFRDVPRRRWQLFREPREVEEPLE